MLHCIVSLKNKYVLNKKRKKRKKRQKQGKKRKEIKEKKKKFVSVMCVAVYGLFKK